jgi:hypothetical protein
MTHPIPLEQLDPTVRRAYAVQEILAQLRPLTADDRREVLAEVARRVCPRCHSIDHCLCDEVIS